MKTQHQNIDNEQYFALIIFCFVIKLYGRRKSFFMCLYLVFMDLVVLPSRENDILLMIPYLNLNTHRGSYGCCEVLEFTDLIACKN